MSLDRLQLIRIAGLPGELGLAPPGIDEPNVVGDLIYVVGRLSRAQLLPVGMALHVGITRIHEDHIEGAAVARTLSMARMLAGILDEDSLRPPHSLAVIVSDELFGDLANEGCLGDDWSPVPRSAAWIRLYPGAGQHLEQERQ